jgi:DNA-binding transcriptional regulator YiaG
MPVTYVCLTCHASFVTYPSKISRGGGKYCSKPCADYGKSHFSLAVLADRFWSRVTKTETCWLWTGYTKLNGYGCLTVEKRPTYAHRMAYELTYGPMLPGLQCLHTCDTPACCRPDHLYAGTPYDNMRDMYERQRDIDHTKPESRPRGDRHGSRTHPERVARGERHGNAKLTDVDVREIRRLRREAHMTMQAIADVFGVSASIVHRILSGAGWKHIS